MYAIRSYYVLVTSIEMDHPDYFKDLDDIYDSFLSYISLLPKFGDLIYCADDKGCLELCKRVAAIRPDINLTGYGQNASGEFKVTDINCSNGSNSFKLEGFNKRLTLKVPGLHTVLDAAGSIAIAFNP